MIAENNPDAFRIGVYCITTEGYFKSFQLSTVWRLDSPSIIRLMKFLSEEWSVCPVCNGLIRKIQNVYFHYILFKNSVAFIRQQWYNYICNFQKLFANYESWKQPWTTYTNTDVSHTLTILKLKINVNGQSVCSFIRFVRLYLIQMIQKRCFKGQKSIFLKF